MKPRLGHLLALALTGWLGDITSAAAQSCSSETEPNDEAVTAAPLAGDFCLAGAATGSDRDLVAWNVDEAAAGQLWQLAIEGLPGENGRLRIARFETAEDGSSREVELLSEAIRPGEGRLLLPPMLLSAGRYLLTVEGSYDGLLYRLRVSAGDGLPAQLPAGDVAGDFAGSVPVPAEAELAVPWTIDEAASSRLWSLTAQVELGASPTIELLDETGTRLAYAYVQVGGIARLDDLGLAPGRYTIEASGRTGARLLLAAGDAGPRAPDREAEPNGDPALAVQFDPAQPLSGRLTGSSSAADDDLLSLTLDESWRGQRFDLVLRAEAEAELRLELLGPDTGALQARTGVGEVRLPDLVMDPGQHLLRVRGALDPDISYTISAESREAVPASMEREPNDTPATAAPFGPEGLVEGEFAGREWDVFALNVDGGAELWRIEAEGAGLERLALYDSAGNVIAEARGSGDGESMRLSNLLLVPGVHRVGLEGVDSPYRLTATRLGPPPVPGTPIAEVLASGIADELEPNDERSRAMRLVPGVPRTGAIDRSGDVDLYRFYLAAESRVRITIDGPPASSLAADLEWGEARGYGPLPRLRTADPGNGARTHLVWDGLLGPGDHYLPMRAEGSAEGPYAVLLELRPYYQRPDDLEPNDDHWPPRPLPADLRLEGTLSPQDTDWYRLPDLDRPATLVIRDLDPGSELLARTGLRIAQEVPPDPADPWPAYERSNIATWYREDGVPEWRGELPAGSGYVLGIEASGVSGAYALEFDFGGVVAVVPSDPLPVALSLALAASEVAAFDTAGQQVQGSLTLVNQGSAPLALILKAHASDERWQVALGEPRLDLAPGATAEVPVTVAVAPDAWAGRPVAIAVAAEAEGGGSPPAFAEAVITPAPAAAPVNPRRVWPLPDSMLGGLDVAAAAVGGVLSVDEPRLTDDGVNQGATAVMTQSELRAGLPVVDLAGEAAVTLSGVLLTPSALPEVSDRMSRFAIATSLDGTSFQHVLEGVLSARPGEQAFPFARPVEARFLRLEPLDTHASGHSGSGAALGELRAVAIPGINPLDPDGIGLNLADPLRGGHVVWSAPAFDGRPMLTAEAERPRFYLESDYGGPVDWVLGFAHNRAGLVTAVEWLSPDAEAEDMPLTVELSASLDSAVGPWTPIGSWDVPEPSSAVTFRFEQPVWARFLRFSALPREAGGQFYLPETLVVREQPVGDGYRSALGEWGELSRDAVYEWQAPASEAPVEAQDDNDTPDTADPLPFDTPAAGSVLLDSDVDWYRIDVPADGHGLVITLSGTPSVYVVPTLQDAGGNTIPLAAPVAGAGEQRFTAVVAPGTYWLRIEDPPRSVALVWDTSGSVSGFIPSIVQGMRTFAEGIRPGREVVNLFPFRGNATAPLLAEWTGDPLTVFLTLHAYPWTDSSSNAEAGLLAASEALAARSGLRAIVLLTDAQSDGASLSPELWASLEATRPRIFTLAVPGGFTGPELWLTRNLMQDWAGVNGGFYQPMLSQGEIDVAFERLAGWLRRPASYQVAVALDRTPPPPPEPGFLQVADSEPAGGETAGAPGSGGILLILDASGSMLQRIDGVRRIEIARETLTTLTGATIPAGTTLGLRVFGQGPPDSCDTGLVVPPQPLDPGAMAQVIAGIQPTNLARTPIGESLRLVPQDMAGVTGPQLVVLITDGEETCDGDPPTEIAALRAMGIDVRVNIVGFAVDDPALAQTFSAWAELGGGRYFDAADASSLGEALTQAVQRRFSVENSRGTVVATGTVGDPPIELPAGTYTVHVDGGGTQRVAVAPSETVTLTGPF